MNKLLFLLPLALLTGCMSFSDKPLRPVRNALAEQLPQITLEKEMAINVGGGMFNMIDVLSQSETDLSEIDSVQVAIYKVHGDLDSVDFNALSFDESLLERDSSLLWERIIRIREADEQVWIFAGMNVQKNSLEAISVFVMEPNEVVLINIDGDINEMMRFALDQSHGRRSSKRHVHDAS